MRKYSQDGSSNNLYEHIRERERDKPPVNGLGIPMKSKLWKPTIALETAERNFYLDNIAFNHQHQVLGKSHVKMDRHNTLKRTEKDNNNLYINVCVTLGVISAYLFFKKNHRDVTNYF